MKTNVDKDLCIGCGLCSSSCPDIYEIQDNIAIVKVETIPDDITECVQQVVKDCPVEAIQISE